MERGARPRRSRRGHRSPSARTDRLRRHRGPLRSRRRHLQRQLGQREAGPAARREGGYTGFEGLFGAKYVNPAINSGSGRSATWSATPIADPFGQPGFPGFDGMLAKNTLGYVAQMQESGVPVTFGYISDAHDFHGVSGNDAPRLRARRGRLRPAAQGLRPGVRGLLQPPAERRDHEEEHAVRGHGRGGRPLRRYAPGRAVRRRHHAVHLQQRPRDRGERRPEADRRHLQRGQRDVGDDELQRPYRHGAERLHQRQSRP